MKRLGFLLFALCCTHSYAANALEGKWKVMDDIGNMRFIVNVYKTNAGKLSAKVIENKSKVNWCVRCKGDNQNKKVRGMSILSGLTPVAGSPQQYDQGTLIDVTTGKAHAVKLKLAHGNIILKGEKNERFTQVWMPLN